MRRNAFCQLETAFSWFAWQPQGSSNGITQQACYEWCYDGNKASVKVRPCHRISLCQMFILVPGSSGAGLAILFPISLVWPWPEPDCWLAQAPWGMVPAPQTPQKRCDDSRLSDLLLKSLQVGAKVTSTPFLPVHWRVPTR